MIDHGQMQLALRSRLLALEVCTTGSTDLAATATGYTRSAGSFIADGFKLGMEITASGFGTAANNGTGVITALTATVMTVSAYTVANDDDGVPTPTERTLEAEAEAAGRTIATALPVMRTWENTPTRPAAGKPYVSEQYIPGPTRQVTVGQDGQLEVTPQYQVQVSVPENTGSGAAREYADALMGLFAPGTSMTLTNGDVLRVRTDTGPFSGQLQRGEAGWVVLPVTFPCRLRTQNQIT